MATSRRYSEDYWAFFECPRPPLSPGLEVVPSKREKELKELNKYSSVMEDPLGKLHRARLPPSILQSLFRREIGSPNSQMIDVRFQSHVLHQLHAARGPRDSSSMLADAVEVNLNKIPKRGQSTHQHETIQVQAGPFCSPTTGKRMKWSQISSSGTAGSSTYKFTFLDDMIMMKEGTSNTRRFLIHNESIFSRSYTVNFSILDEDKTKLKWRSHDLSLINTHNPQMRERKVAKIPKSLLVLESTGKLLRYDLNNGTKMEELVLTYPGGPLYSTLEVDHAVGENGIFVVANTAAVKKSHPGMLLELLIISPYPELRVCHRLLFPKGGEFGAMDGVSLAGELLAISRSTSVEFFNLQQVLYANPPNKCRQTTNGANIHERIILFYKPAQSLGFFRSKGGFSCIIEGAHPPTICIKTNDVYEVRCLDKPEEVIGEIGYKSRDDEVSLRTYDSDKPRLAVTGLPHGFDIYYVDTSGRCLKLLYSTRDYEAHELSLQQENASDSGSSSTDSTSKRSGLRQLAKKNYADKDRMKSFGFGLEHHLGLMAVCMVVDGTLKTTILDNETLKPIRRLSSVKLSPPKGMSANLECSNVSVQFNATHIVIQLCLFDADKTGGNFHRVYTANLIGEEVQMP